MINYRVTGKMIQYYGNNNKFRECNYIDDKLNGEYIEYDINGNIRNITYFVDDEIFTGANYEFYYHENNYCSIKCEYSLKNGKKKMVHINYIMKMVKLKKFVIIKMV
jgi:antitoxin component YwqK of YwqJK toxin-antitoxin module